MTATAIYVEADNSLSIEVAGQRTPLGAKPHPAAVIDASARTWVVPLAAAKTAKWEEMKLARSAAIETPLVTAYGTFDADDQARTNIIQTAHLMQTQAQALAPGAVPTVQFTLADNTVATLTAAQMVEVALLLAAQIQNAYSRGRTVRAAIDAATTAQQVAAITWSTP